MFTSSKSVNEWSSISTDCTVYVTSVIFFTYCFTQQ